ncbi:MAG: hypothetical protein LUC27_01940, partial [Lachnospiraceae bacterium]|nr:hypothetical protein [Lachnospiraceae bacterium]
WMIAGIAYCMAALYPSIQQRVKKRLGYRAVPEYLTQCFSICCLTSLWLLIVVILAESSFLDGTEAFLCALAGNAAGIISLLVKNWPFLPKINRKIG